MINLIKAKVLINEINKLNPEEEANKLALLIDQVLDDSLGDKRSEEVQQRLVPFINKFSMALTKKLLEDNV